MAEPAAPAAGDTGLTAATLGTSADVQVGEQVEGAGHREEVGEPGLAPLRMPAHTPKAWRESDRTGHSTLPAESSRSFWSRSSEISTAPFTSSSEMWLQIGRAHV
mgnify:CR=1 FL=1